MPIEDPTEGNPFRFDVRVRVNFGVVIVLSAAMDLQARALCSLLNSSRVSGGQNHW
jgi:hypothetical protein